MKPDALPNDATGDALRRVLDHGSDLSKPVDIDFHVAVPDERAAERIECEIKKLGYSVTVTQDEEDKEWTCTCTITMLATHRAISQAEQQLDKISQPHGGYSDGWATFGNAEET